MKQNRNLENQWEIDIVRNVMNGSSLLRKHLFSHYHLGFYFLLSVMESLMGKKDLRPELQRSIEHIITTF